MSGLGMLRFGILATVRYGTVSRRFKNYGTVRYGSTVYGFLRFSTVFYGLPQSTVNRNKPQQTVLYGFYGFLRFSTVFYGFRGLKDRFSIVIYLYTYYLRTRSLIPCLALIFGLTRPSISIIRVVCRLDGWSVGWSVDRNFTYL